MWARVTMQLVVQCDVCNIWIFECNSLPNWLVWSYTIYAHETRWYAKLLKHENFKKLGNSFPLNYWCTQNIYTNDIEPLAALSDTKFCRPFVTASSWQHPPDSVPLTASSTQARCRKPRSRSENLLTRSSPRWSRRPSQTKPWSRRRSMRQYQGGQMIIVSHPYFTKSNCSVIREQNYCDPSELGMPILGGVEI